MTLSELFSDPVLRTVFRRAERDLGQAFTIPPTRPLPTLKGGAAESHTSRRERELA